MKRRGRRAEFHGWVELATTSGRRRRAQGRDLSSGGLGILLEDDPPHAGTRVESEFALPGFFVPLSLPARVAWTDPEHRRAGLRFEGLDAGVAELLENFVSGRLS